MRYVYRPGHPKASPNGFVKATDLGWEEETHAVHAPILMDRFYENTRATDGTDIGSRRKHRAYMKEKGWTTADDFDGMWKRAQKEREAISKGSHDTRERRDQVERALHKHFKP